MLSTPYKDYMYAVIEVRDESVRLPRRRQGLNGGVPVHDGIAFTREIRRRVYGGWGI